MLDPLAGLDVLLAATPEGEGDGKAALVAVIAAIVSAAAAVVAALYAASADKRLRRALDLAEKADEREGEAHDASKRANLILDGFKAMPLDAAHYYANVQVKNVGQATARNVSIVLGDEQMQPTGDPKPIAALDPGARSNQSQLHAPGALPEKCHVLASWADDAGPHADERIGP